MIELKLGPARIIFSDRHGGFSSSPFSTANMALVVGDNSDTVTRNRQYLSKKLDLGDSANWKFLNQVHGSEVLEVFGSLTAARYWPPYPEADAAVTNVAGQVLVITTADCAPVAIVGETSLAVVHAGWRGLLAGVVGAAVAKLRSHGETHLRAILGPCIHPDYYEFGDNELKTLTDRFGDSVAGLSKSGSPALDLPATVRAALTEVGVAELTDVGICTAASSDYFSYRRNGTTGRQVLLAVLE